MMDKGLQEMYYIARYNMGRYVKTSFGHYYQIVGFAYVDYWNKGFIVIKENNISTYNDVMKDRLWIGIRKIFLTKCNAKNHHYAHYMYSNNITIVDKKEYE